MKYGSHHSDISINSKEMQKHPLTRQVLFQWISAAHLQLVQPFHGNHCPAKSGDTCPCEQIESVEKESFLAAAKEIPPNGSAMWRKRDRIELQGVTRWAAGDTYTGFYYNS